MTVTEQAVAATTLTLEMSGISKRYAGVAALSDVSLEVRPGEVHAVLGENGAGKSTLMGVATGTVVPDVGTVSIRGHEVRSLDPRRALELGVAIVHQHPAVLPDLTVQENLEVALPRSVFKDGSPASVTRRLLDQVGLEAEPTDRVETLTLAEKHLLEIAKAFAVRPELLVLDEPTAPLGGDATALLFTLVRDAVEQGTSVVYITHRLAEVRELADRVTVLRDGRVRGTSEVAAISDDELLTLIVGREMASTFPPKVGDAAGEPDLELTGLTGHGFEDVAVQARRGEIVGIAGVAGNGQAELLRALAGLDELHGTVRVCGTTYSRSELTRRTGYVPADRHAEGLMMSLTVRENAALTSLQKFKSGFLLSRSREVAAVRSALGSLSLKAASIDAPVRSLSGGNQQKVVLSRSLLSEPVLLVADEPTQGVDVGARMEIYSILREASARGVPVVVASSDAKELEGLCDTVLVMSRGHVVATLTGDEVTEERIVAAAVSSTAEVSAEAAHQRESGRLRKLLQSDYAPTGLLVLVMLALALWVAPGNDRYLSAFNISNILLAATAIGFIALGQNLALLTGGIDLSVGPLAGFLVVVSSFFVNDGKSAATVVVGIVLMVVVAAVVGTVNGTLIRFGKFTPIAATLTLYIALGGFAFLLRPTQDGYISLSYQTALNSTVGPVPVAFLVFLVVAVLMEYLLRRRPWGWQLRAVGSDEEAARRIGVRVDRTVVLAYVAGSLLVVGGALVLMAQYGVGDPSQGTAFTLTSVTAVVLGGTSLLGGRGTFIGTLVGAVLLQQVLNATTFLGLGSTSQYYFQGVLVLAAAVAFSLTRTRTRKAPRP